MKNKVTNIDRGYKALMVRLSTAGSAVTVGIHEGEGGQPAKGSKDTALINVAGWNEFGTDRIPQRSFVRAWFDEKLAENRVNFRKLAMSVVRGEHNVSWLYNTLGVLFVGQIQNRISDGILPENAESTVLRKHSTTPLIDTGQLRSSITYQLEGVS